LENTIQVSDSLVLNKNLIDDIRFQYRRIRNHQLPVSDLPSVSVQGAFTTGGSNSGTVEDHQDDFEFQDYFAAAEGRHSLNFGTRLRAYRDANYTSAGSNSSYTFYTPSIAADPGFDYGRAGFDIHNRFVLLGNMRAPWQLSFAPFLSANSGTPYNITTGSDLTGNNQFNARPTFAASCGQPGAVSTPYGCLDPDPLSSPSGASEKIVPHNLGIGPRNVSLNLRVSKTIGFGPRTGGEEGSPGTGEGRGRSGGFGGGLGPQGLSGSQSGPVRPGESSSHKYSLTFSVYGQNIFNHENLGTPNGTLSSPLFGKSQSLAGGFFGPSTAGNRRLFFATDFHF
jgi:hypothetical protein